jgi:hypothetical protein
VDTGFKTAHERNDNVLLEYEHMLSLLTTRKVDKIKLNKIKYNKIIQNKINIIQGKVKVFPLFIDGYPCLTDYPNLPHVTTGKNIRETLGGVSICSGNIRSFIFMIQKDVEVARHENQSRFTGSSWHFFVEQIE